MTTRTDFGPQEWELVSEGPPSAALLVITSQRGGVFRETFAMAKEYAHVRGQHGNSQLLDDLVATRPHVDHSRYHSPEELREAVVKHLSEAMGILRAKAQPQEVEDYRSFVVSVSEHVAAAHRNHGTDVSTAEQEAIQAIEAALGPEKDGGAEKTDGS